MLGGSWSSQVMVSLEIKFVTIFIIVELKTEIWSLVQGHSTPTGAKFVRLGYVPCQGLIRICQVLQYARYDNPENFSLIFCTV